MGEELNRSLQLLAERGAARGAEAVLASAREEAAAEPEARGTTWQRGLVVAFGAAAAVLLLVGAGLLFARPFGGDETPPATTVAPVPTTVPVPPAPSVESAGPLNDVNELALAPDGSLWAATPAGLVQWDVATGDFTVFTEAEGVPGRGIETLAIAPDGTVWVVTDRGIGSYDGSWQVYTAENNPELDGQIGALVVDQDGVVWVAVASEPIARFDGSWAAVDPVPAGGWPAIMPGALAVGPDGTLWVGTRDEGVLAFDGSAWEHFDEADGAPPRASNVVVGPDGTIWAWDNGYYTDGELTTYVPGTGFGRYDGTAWTTYTVDDGLLSNEGYLVVDTSGTVTVMHTELGPDHEPVEIGVSRFDGATWMTSRDVDDSLAFGSVVGADGTLWMPTASGIVGSFGTDDTELVVPRELATPPILPVTLTRDPEQAPIRVSTVLGDFEFETLRTSGNDVFDTEITPFGWMAFGENLVRRSNDGLTWDLVLAGADGSWIMADGPDLIVYGWGFVRYLWDGTGWVEVAAVDLPGRIQGLAFGSSGAVALVNNTVYHSTDGVVFAPAAAGPDLAPATGRPVGCTGLWPDISLAGPSGGPILVTDSGFVLLAPSYGNWDPLPICEPRAWVSTDGSQWELLTPESPFGESAIADVAAFDGRFVAMGERAVWVSDDGIEWQQAEVPQLDSARGLAGGDLGWFLVGGASNSDTSSLPADMWFSADGLIWDGPFAGPEGLGWAFFHIEPTVGSDAIYSVTGTHDGFVVGQLHDERDWKES